MALFRPVGQLNLDPISTGLSVIGGIGGAISGHSAAAAQKELARRQSQILQRQAQTYGQVAPTYLQAVQQLAQHAGIGGYGGQGAGLGGAFGTPEDRMRLAAFEEMNNRQALQGANRLQHDLAARGIAQGSQAAALAQNERARQGAYANFGRQLAIAAPQEMERRNQLLLSALNPGLGMGGQAAAGYGQQSALAGQQAAGSYANLANTLQQFMYGQRLGGYQPGPVLGGKDVIAGAGGKGDYGVPYGDYGVDYYIGPNGEIIPIG